MGSRLKKKKALRSITDLLPCYLEYPAVVEHSNNLAHHIQFDNKITLVKLPTTPIESFIKVLRTTYTVTSTQKGLPEQHPHTEGGH
jgi:hypothetical protein